MVVGAIPRQQEPPVRGGIYSAYSHDVARLGARRGRGQLHVRPRRSRQQGCGPLSAAGSSPTGRTEGRGRPPASDRQASPAWLGQPPRPHSLIGPTALS